MYAYERTLLACYNTAEEMIENMDEIFMKAALGSYYSKEPCEIIAEKLIGMTERKDELIYVRDTVDEALGRLSDVSRRHIAFKYFGAKDEEIKSTLKTRNYFRRQLVALNKFSAVLRSMGFDEEEFCRRCTKFAFYSIVYERFKNNETKLPSSCYRVTGERSLATDFKAIRR